MSFRVDADMMLPSTEAGFAYETYSKQFSDKFGLTPAARQAFVIEKSDDGDAEIWAKLRAPRLPRVPNPEELAWKASPENPVNKEKTQ